MAETTQMTLPLDGQSAEPTLQESYDKLVEDGHIEKDGVVATETAQTPEQPQAEERPGWLPEKFASPEDMAKSYAELERKLSGGDEPAEQPTDETAEGEETSPAPAVDGLIGSAEQEFMSTGALSDATFDALAAAGIPRETVEAVRDMRVREAETNRQAIVQEFGGDQKVDSMSTWAADHYEDGMIVRLNGMLNSGDYGQTRMAMAMISSDYDRTVGSTEPQRTVGGTRSGPEGFRSTAEMLEAINDPRYKADDAYRADVERKIGRM